MSVSATDVLDIAPEFSAVAIAKINRFIERAKLSANEKVFGLKYDLAVTYMTAHMLSRSVSSTEAPGTTALVVTSEKVGQLSRNYGSVGGTATESSLNLTKYGQEFQRLVRECATRPIIITDGIYPT